MTRRTSLRAAARENYREMAQAKARAEESAPTPDPSSLRFDGQAPTPQGGGEENDPPPHSSGVTSLTARVRELYESSAVPVREIAALVGVTERTIYKYVIKQNWQRRYACVAREDDAVARANRGRRWQRAPGHEPVKGAGGRFIRRADADKPIATGLKATDPAGRAQALAACAGAARLADEAQARALADRRRAQCDVALASLNRMMAEYNAFRKGCAGRRARNLKPSPLEGRIEETHVLLVEKALSIWQALQEPAAA